MSIKLILMEVAMIREYRETDLKRIMNIWLETNICTHDFIENYWKSNYDQVRHMMPAAIMFMRIIILKGLDW